MILPNSRSAHVTLPGRRPTNEDSVVDIRFPDGRHLVAVADGMGGHQSGEIASSMALEVLCREVGAGRTLTEGLTIANAKVHEEASRNPLRLGMGTTLVALLRQGSAYEIANVGDSRAYRVDREGIGQITRDHSFAAEAAMNKVMSPDEIARSPWRNALTRSLGTHPTVEVDVFGPFEIPGASHLVLLCSDGVYRVLSNEVMRDVVLEAGDIRQAAEALSGQAFRNRSDDNISVAVVEFGNILAPLTMSRPTGRGAAAPALAAPAPVAAPKVTVPVPPIPAAAPTVPAPTAPVQATAPQISVPAPRVARRRPGWLRRVVSMATNDNTLFGVSLGALLVWLLVQLISR